MNDRTRTSKPQHWRWATWGAGAALAALALTGCGGGTEPTAASSPPEVTASTATPTPTPVVSWDNASDFVSAIWADDYDEASTLVAKGSAAERYITHQAAAMEAVQAAGTYRKQEAPEITVDEDQGAITMTVSSENDEYVWDEWQLDAEGKITGWSVAGDPVSERLWTKSPSVKAGGAKVSLVSAYQASSGNLWVVLDVTAGSKNLRPDISATLVGKDERQRQAGSMDAPESIPAGTSAYVVLVFDGADFGGTLTYEVLGSDYNALGKARLKIS